MNYLKKIGLGLLYTVSITLVLTLIVTILNYFGIIGSGLLSILEILIALIACFVGGFQIGKKSKQKGWLEGLKFSLILFIMIIIMNLIFKNNLEIKNTLYYLIILSLATIGSIIGVNKSSSN